MSTDSFTIAKVTEFVHSEFLSKIIVILKK